MLEKDIESWSSKFAVKHGWWTRKFTAPGRRSVPDRIFGRLGRVFFVEFKRAGCKPTELQYEEHKLMRVAGLTVYVCDSRAQFGLILEGENAALLPEGFDVP